MKYSSSLRIMTKILWIGVVGMFVVTEVVALLAFRKIPNDHPLPGVGTIYFISFMVALPMVAGMNGYYSVRRRLSSVGDDVISALSVQFLVTIAAAYAALMVCIGPMAKALLRF